MDKQQPTPAEWAIIGGGVVALIGSFLDFEFERSAWGEFNFPIATLIALYCVAMAVIVALTRFANVNLPDRVLGFTWPQIHLVLGFFAALMALFWLVAAEDAGVGLYLMLIGAVAAAVGAFMMNNTASTGAAG